MAIKWKFYKGHHQTTIRIDEGTAEMLELAFVDLDNRTIQKLVIDSLRHYCSCTDAGAHANQIQIIERRLTILERSNH